MQHSREMENRTNIQASEREDQGDRNFLPQLDLKRPHGRDRDHQNDEVLCQCKSSHGHEESDLAFDAVATLVLVVVK